MNKKKLLQRIVNRPNNVRFDDLKAVVEAFGFRISRISGSHYIYVHPQVNELINLQDVKGQAKPYQIKQLLELIELYDLEMED